MGLSQKLAKVGQIVNIVGLWPTWSIKTTQLCHCNRNLPQAMWKQMDATGFLSLNIFLLEYNYFTILGVSDA